MENRTLETVVPIVNKMREAEMNLIASMERINSGVLISEWARRNCFEDAVKRMLSAGFSIDYVNKMVEYINSNDILE